MDRIESLSEAWQLTCDAAPDEEITRRRVSALGARQDARLSSLILNSHLVTITSQFRRTSLAALRLAGPYHATLFLGGYKPHWPGTTAKVPCLRFAAVGHHCM